MTAQVHEELIFEGNETSMAFCPPLPKNNPRLIESIGNQGLNTACWRGYRGSWEIKKGKFFLFDVRGKYQLIGGPPIFADWFTRTIKIPEGDILEYVHGGFSTVYELELHIAIKDGLVVKKITIDNRPQVSDEIEVRAAIEQEKRQRQRDAERVQEQLEEGEFQNLVAEMKQFGFTHSSQVSKYIISNRLGYNYKNISGILQMELDGTTWNFKGGFPPKIYAKLCDELGLSNNGTKARAVAFESFDNIEKRFPRK